MDPWHSLFGWKPSCTEVASRPPSSAHNTVFSPRLPQLTVFGIAGRHGGRPPHADDLAGSEGGRGVPFQHIRQTGEAGGGELSNRAEAVKSTKLRISRGGVTSLWRWCLAKFICCGSSPLSSRKILEDVACKLASSLKSPGKSPLSRPTTAYCLLTLAAKLANHWLTALKLMANLFVRWQGVISRVMSRSDKEGKSRAGVTGNKERQNKQCWHCHEHPDLSRFHWHVAAKRRDTVANKHKTHFFNVNRLLCHFCFGLLIVSLHIFLS